MTRTLRNAVMRRRLAHAYLFTGPRGTGKTSVARILYRAANCERSVDGDPCNTCPLCLAALEGRAMELMEIDAASNRGIDDIRDLREKVAFRPSEGAYRLYIIDEAHELTTPAWDAFLKTLEEPPAHAIFVLATTEAHKVPATIVSRCQRFDFRRIPFEATREQLARVAAAEKLEVDPNVLERLARVARGGLRDALSLLDQLSAFAGGHVDMQVARAVLGLPPVEAVRAVIEALGRHDVADLMARISDMAEGGADLRQFVEELAANLRALLIARAGGESTLASEFSAEELAWLRQQVPAWTVGSLIALVQELTNALARTRDSQQFQVQVELSLLRVCQPVTNQVQESAVREIASQRAAVRAETGIDSNAGKQQAPRTASASWPVALDSQPAQEKSDGSAERVKGASGPVGDSPPALAETNPTVGRGSREEPHSYSATTTRDSNTLAAVRARWQDIVERVTAKRSLASVRLSDAQAVKVADGTIVVAFGGPGGRKQCEWAQVEKNRVIIEEAFQHVLGAPYRLRCLVGTGDSATPSLLDDPVIRSAVRMFGGQPRRME